jgi:flavorubredoxin
MGVTNIESGTNIQEVADGIYRINTPLPPTFIPGGFSFNQYLIVDDEPLLFHTGLRKMFPLVREAVQSVMPVEKLRFVAFSHFEQDECGSLSDWLAASPEAIPVCSKIAAMTSINDLAERAPKVLVDGETLSLGSHVVRWFDTPHLPHGWECGYMMEQKTRTFLCGDLFTQSGAGETALTESDILGPSEAARSGLDYFSHARNTREMLERLAASEPTTLACMHGSAWRGDGASLLRALADELDRER